MPTETVTNLQLQEQIERLEISMGKRMDDLTEKVESIDHRVNGNGSPGLRSEIFVIKKWIEARARLEIILLTSMTAFFITGIGTLMVWLVRIALKTGQVSK